MHISTRNVFDARRIMMAACLLIIAGIGVYHSSFGGAFVFDDAVTVVRNDSIRTLWPPWEMLFSPPQEGTEARPVVTLSRAVNFALGGLNTWGYHLFNLAVHILTALALFGVLRRTFLLPSLRNRFGHEALWLAWIVALVWLVHPLQTASVTYIKQRAESMAGLFYLLTLYGFLRSTAPSANKSWFWVSILSCTLGMGCKATLVTAPVAVFLYDRTFISGSFRRAWQKHGKLHRCLTATWCVLVGLLVYSFYVRGATGLEFKDHTWLEYIAAQPGVLLHYLRLAVWPHPLVFHYHWTSLEAAKSVWLCTFLLGFLLSGTLWLLRFRPSLGFLGAWFLMILSPTSFVPLSNMADEHRMYLPLVSVIILGVLGIRSVLEKASSSGQMRKVLPIGLIAAVVLALGAATVRRNYDYESELRLWQDTVFKRPENSRAHYNLGVILTQDGRRPEAVTHYQKALEIEPGNANAHNNVGALLAQMGRPEKAAEHLLRALEIKPDDARAHDNLGVAYTRMGEFSKAVNHYTEALRIRPVFPRARMNMGVALSELGYFGEAIRHYERVLTLMPDSVEAHHNMAVAFAKWGRLAEAEAYYKKTLELNPDYFKTRVHLGALFVQQRKFEEALFHLSRALHLNPNSREAHHYMGTALEGLGRTREARVHLDF